MSLQAEAISEIGNLAGKYLTFALADEIYALDILKVQEIIGAIKITPVPKSPDYLRGVVNLRGKIIPVVDLRLKLGMEGRAYDEKTCFVVVNTKVKGEPVSVGVAVDTVLEVVNFEASHLQEPPEYGSNLDSGFIMGMGRINENVIILVEIDRCLADAGSALSEAV